jgi:transcriptional regulator with XRE-family HTH domain
VNEQQFMITLGQRIRYARMRAGLTQQKLSKRVGVSRAQITNIERGVGGASLWTIARIAAGCEIDLHTLLNPSVLPHREEERP